MRADERLRALQAILSACRDLWHPQPFRQESPAWCARWPALAAQLLALSDDECAHLNDDGVAARALLAGHLPEVAALDALLALPFATARPQSLLDPFWDWEIPGRKRAQIEAFAATVAPCGRPLFDWCGGKGHLARLLALRWQALATTLEIDAALCADGAGLARRAGAEHAFVVADALDPQAPLPADAHVVALHACGGLHRQLLRRAVTAGVAALDLAPCCYYHGVDEAYPAMSKHAALPLDRDDLRLAVTETVTAAPRVARQSARAMAWKLAFIALRQRLDSAAYRTFKPVPSAWTRGDFESFCRQLAARERLALPEPLDWPACEAEGWRRQHQVKRLSVVRHAFRRPLEIWLLADMAAFLEEAGYRVSLAEFCPRRLTPRNVLLSARLA